MSLIPRYRTYFEIIMTAVIYILSARIGQLFAIEPGNITPVWIPSGLMIALVLYKGTYIWPGVFIGAFLGNIWAYLTFNSLQGVITAIAAAILNGIGDTISCVVMAYFILRHSQTRYPFTSIQNFLVYIGYAVITGPFISAVFGVGGLTFFGFIEDQNFYTSFITWFIGDATGVMIFGPLLLCWLTKESYSTNNATIKISALAIFSTVFTACVFNLVTPPRFLYAIGILCIPMALFIVMHSGQRAVFTIQSLVSVVAVYATSFNIGPFSNIINHEALLDLQLFIAATSLVMFTIAIIVHNHLKTYEQLKIKQIELEKLYRQDQLTKTWNRYRITEFIEIELLRFQRSQRSFGLMMIDIDNFKLINDRYGHIKGDKVLVRMSKLIKSVSRDSDLFGRWGGEEFIIVCINMNKKSLLILGEKIRNLIDQHDFCLDIKITISIGATLSQKNDTIKNIVNRADEALYNSKKNGKNTVNFK